MGKKVSYIFIMIMIFTLVSCGSSVTNVSDEPIDLNAIPIVTFGNQGYNREDVNYYIAENDNIYISKKNSITKVHIDNPEIQTVVYEDKELNGVPTEIYKYEEWIYFKIENEDNGYLYRVKEGSSDIVKLLDSVSTYVLTEDKIYYSTFRTDDTSTVNVMNLDGSVKHKFLSSDCSLIGLDNGWIYYYKEYDLYEEYTPYRITKDGKKKEKVFEVFDLKNYPKSDMIYDFIVDKNFIAYVYDSDIPDKKELVMKNIGEKERTFKIDSTFECLNKEGEWLYYMEWDKVYKLNIKEKSKKQLVYDFNINSETKSGADSVQLHNGNALLTMDIGSVYIKADGTIIELGVNP